MKHFTVVCRACSAPRWVTSACGATQDDLVEQQGRPAGMYSKAIGPEVGAAVVGAAATQWEREADPVIGDLDADSEVSCRTLF